jgi:polyisoprenoid-binding protein YceI
MTERARTALPTGTWKIDAIHSYVGFAVYYIAGTFRGSFAPVEGKLEVAEDGAATLSGKASAGAVQVQDANLMKHLQSDEFFDAENAPELAFASTDIRPSGEEVEIAGELQIRGASCPVTLQGRIGSPTTDTFGKERFNLTLEGTIELSAFGIPWNDELPSGEPALANEVTLTAELYLVKEPS